MIDYYEFLQISPHADADTIHRVYRYLAGRLHPDNPESGDAEMFRLLKLAFDTLSNRSRRAEYDALCRRESAEAAPLSNAIDFMDSVEGEMNRRVAVLAVLYFKRRTNPRFPEVSLAEIERRMGFPRDYLDFTTWYLVKKGYVSKADNSDFTLTAEGVDYIETQRTNLPILNKLLTDGKTQFAGSSQNTQTVIEWIACGNRGKRIEGNYPSCVYIRVAGSATDERRPATRCGGSGDHGNRSTGGQARSAREYERSAAETGRPAGVCTRECAG